MNQHSEVVFALVQKNAKSRVGGGENSGANLTHVQVVRRLIHFPLRTRNKNTIVMTFLKDTINEKFQVIDFVQNTFTGEITAAGSFELPAKNK